MKRSNNLKKGLVAILVLALLAVSFVVYKFSQRNVGIWLADYLFNSPTFEESERLTDIIFLTVDHWEPGGSMIPVKAWMEGYRELSDKHIDADGIKLRHTWAYPIDGFRGFEVDSLVQLCLEGRGDVEVQLHHRDDTEETLRAKLLWGIDSLQAHGALRSLDGQTRFGFVHGNWSLDNSRIVDGRNFCGVNNEISMLLDLGCYVDLTFPALFQLAQPSLVNKIYYCTDDPDQPKSHDYGPRVKVGSPGAADQLMIFEGSFMIDWTDWRFVTHPTFEDGNLFEEIPTTLHRFEVWLEANVHVEGRPEWVFVKTFTHGAHLRHPDAYDNILGANIDRMLTEVEAKYNDGSKYRLHYMTAREAYNVVKAAEAGMSGNPNDYRDFLVKPYKYQALAAE